MISSLPAVPGMATATPPIKRALGALDCVAPGLAEPLCVVISLFTDGTFDAHHNADAWHPVESPAVGLLRWYEGTACHAGVPKGFVPRHRHWLRLWPYTGCRIWSIALMPGEQQVGYALRFFDRMRALHYREPYQLALVALGTMPSLRQSWLVGKVPYLPQCWDRDRDGHVSIQDLIGCLRAVSEYARAFPRVPITSESTNLGVAA